MIFLDYIPQKNAIFLDYKYHATQTIPQQIAIKEVQNY